MKLHTLTLMTLTLGISLSGCSGTATPPSSDLGADGAAAAYTPLSCAFETTNANVCLAPTDYSPRLNQSMNATWPRCASDGNTFVMVGKDEPAAAARARAFDAMGLLLWKKATAPTSADFTAARDQYSVAEGIGSRVQRRQDVHYPELPKDTKLSCADAATSAKYPDRCASPAKILPIITDAFTQGTAGTRPRVQAARIEAGLIWFLYLSSLSEVWTCSFDDELDCDSAWGYYTASQQRDKPAALAAYYNALSPAVHNRVFDALLGERCWSDTEGNKLPKTNQRLYCVAQNQLDRAELQGLALILRDRLGQIPAATTEVKEAHLEFAKILGGFLDRAARQRDATKADALKAQWSAAAPDKVDVKAAQDALDALFGCT